MWSKSCVLKPLQSSVIEMSDCILPRKLYSGDINMHDKNVFYMLDSKPKTQRNQNNIKTTILEY